MSTSSTQTIIWVMIPSLQPVLFPPIHFFKFRESGGCESNSIIFAIAPTHACSFVLFWWKSTLSLHKCGNFFSKSSLNVVKSCYNISLLIVLPFWWKSISKVERSLESRVISGCAQGRELSPFLWNLLANEPLGDISAG